MSHNKVYSMPHDTARPLVKKNGLGYHFIPARFQKATILIWLKRVHAWTGLWGALIFLLVGTSGFLLNHRSTLKIDTGKAIEVADIEIKVATSLINSGRDLERWVQERFGFKADKAQIRTRLRQRARFNGEVLTRPARYDVRLRGPNRTITADYTQGANTVSLKEVENNVWAFLKNLHKGSGLGVMWILFFDTVAGALLMMSLTGFLLWSKLHGPRLVGLGLLFGSLGVAISAAFPFVMGSLT